MTTIFSVWEIDEPEFAENTEYKFNPLVHPVHMAIGTGGKNDHLAKETIDILADWALRKLFVACAKVLWWIMWKKAKRILTHLT